MKTRLINVKTTLTRSRWNTSWLVLCINTQSSTALLHNIGLYEGTFAVYICRRNFIISYINCSSNTQKIIVGVRYYRHKGYIQCYIGWIYMLDSVLIQRSTHLVCRLGGQPILRTVFLQITANNEILETRFF